MDRYSDYDPFAYVYNKHWGNNFIPLVIPILESNVLNRLPENARILDLCCGTGQLARILNDRGYQVTGLDGSIEMLRYARENAPDVEFILDDARTFELTGTYHAVICTFDSLNHILELEELTAVFRNVYESLEKGGIFFFDLNMEAGFQRDINGDFSIIEDDNVVFQRYSYNPDEKIARYETTIFLLDEIWQRTDCTLLQKCYSELEVITALESAGFTDIQPRSYDLPLGLTELTSDSHRAFFICKKQQH